VQNEYRATVGIEPHKYSVYSVKEIKQTTQIASVAKLDSLKIANMKVTQTQKGDQEYDDY
jgi:hypothetical protein